jgi:hypothetical protein
MWLGLLYDTYDDAPAGENDESAMVILYAWGDEPDRPVSVAGPAGAAADSARVLRDAGWRGAPRCATCDTAFDLPLD